MKQTYATQEYHLEKDEPQHEKLAPANTNLKLRITQLTYSINIIIFFIFLFIKRKCHVND